MRKPFTQEENDYIRANYLKKSARQISKELGRHPGAATKQYGILGLHVPEDVKAKFWTGNPSRKGKARSSWMGPAAEARCRDAGFQRGREGPNKKKAHEIVIRQNRDGRQYSFIKLDSGKWQILQRYVWEQNKGAIPASMKVAFKDGDTSNFDISNLELVTNSDMGSRNTYYNNYPPELVRAIYMRGILNRKINQQNKK